MSARKTPEAALILTEAGYAKLLSDLRKLVTTQAPHPPLRGLRVPVAHVCNGPNRPRARRAFPQEGKENKDFPSPLGRGQGEGPELLRKLWETGKSTSVLNPGSRLSPG